MPYLNKYWKTYGCEKCNNYKCLVLYVNGYIDASNDNNTSQNVQASLDYVVKYGITCPFISRWVGGGQIFCQTNGFSYGGGTYIIRPNRTWKAMSAYAYNENDIPSEGIQPHVCSGADLEAPKVAVTAPAQNGVLQAGTKQIIRWTATDNIGVISRTIRFSSNNGSNWTLVDSAAGNTGDFQWTVPNTVSKVCKIKVSAYDAARNFGNGESGIFEISATGIFFNPATAADHIECKKAAGMLMVYIPFTGNGIVSISDVKGKTLAFFITSGNRQWYSITQGIPSGMIILNITNSNQTINKKVCFTR